MSKFSFTAFSEFTSNGLKNCMVSFTPAITIGCNPPYTKGKKDTCWIKYRPDHRPSSKEELETCLGMSILDWE